MAFLYSMIGFLKPDLKIFFPPLIVYPIHIYWCDKHWDLNSIIFHVMLAIALLFFFIIGSLLFPPFCFSFSGKALVSVLYFSFFMKVMAIVYWQVRGHWSRIQGTERGGHEPGLKSGSETGSVTFSAEGHGRQHLSC